MTQTKRRLDFLMRRCCGLRPSQLMQMWYVSKSYEPRAMQRFAEWVFAMAVLKLRCLKRFHFQYESVVRDVHTELFRMDDRELEPCGLIRIPKLQDRPVEDEPQEDVFDLPDEDMEHDDSAWY